MNYYILADLAVFGLFLCGLGIAIWWFERKARRYAVVEPDRAKIRMHQKIRRLENGYE